MASPCTLGHMNEWPEGFSDENRGGSYGRGSASAQPEGARVMRQVLVDHARKRNAGKRGGGSTSLTIADDAPARQTSIVDVLALDEALTDLATLDQRLCQVVELKCFTGLNIEETADALGVSTATVERDWAVAKAWLFDRLSTPRRT